MRCIVLTFMIAGIFGCQTSPEAVSPSSTSTQNSAAKKSALNKSDDIKPPGNEIPKVGTKSELSNDEWIDRLTSKQHKILRQQGTERAFTGVYDKFYEEGTYHCSGCNAPLYTSDTKFNSGTGWPSFHTAVDGRVGRKPDNKFGMRRVELVCNHCDGHLGHVFQDGPKPTGERHCINSHSLYFRPSDS